MSEIRHRKQRRVLWDRARIHRGQPVHDWLAAHPEVQVEPLPAYATELNPVEGAWNELRRKELANVSCLDLRALRQHVRRGTHRLQHRTDLIRGFFAETGYL